MKHLAKILSVAATLGALAASPPAQAAFYIRDQDVVVLKEYVPAPPTHITFYTPGTVLPSTVSYEILPETVTERMMPAPENTAYVRVGGDVYLIDTNTREILDARQIY